MACARHIEVGECMLVTMGGLIDRYKHLEEGMTLVIKAQEIPALHHRQYSLSSHQCQSSSRVGIGRPNNTIASLETTL